MQNLFKKIIIILISVFAFLSGFISTVYADDTVEVKIELKDSLGNFISDNYGFKISFSVFNGAEYVDYDSGNSYSFSNGTYTANFTSGQYQAHLKNDDTATFEYFNFKDGKDINFEVSSDAVIKTFLGTITPTNNDNVKNDPSPIPPAPKEEKKNEESSKADETKKETENINKDATSSQIVNVSISNLVVGAEVSIFNDVGLLKKATIETGTVLKTSFSYIKGKTYYITVKNPANFSSDNTKYTIDTSNLVFKNNEATAPAVKTTAPKQYFFKTTIEVLDDSENPVKNAKIGVYLKGTTNLATDTSGKSTIGFTDDSGLISFFLYSSKEYFVKQLEVPEKYFIDEEEYKVSVNSNYYALTIDEINKEYRVNLVNTINTEYIESETTSEIEDNQAVNLSTLLDEQYSQAKNQLDASLLSFNKDEYSEEQWSLIQNSYNSALAILENQYSTLQLDLELNDLSEDEIFFNVPNLSDLVNTAFSQQQPSSSNVLSFISNFNFIYAEIFFIILAIALVLLVKNPFILIISAVLTNAANCAIYLLGLSTSPLSLILMLVGLAVSVVLVIIKIVLMKKNSFENYENFEESDDEQSFADNN